MKRLKVILSATSLLGLLVTPAIGGAIYDFSQAPVSHDPIPASLGFLFTTNRSIEVTSLGYFDQGGDGFATAHTVGIYDSYGDLLTSITLGAGAGAALDGDFRYESIKPIVLAAGQTYKLVGTSGGYADGWAYGVAGRQLQGLNVDPSITIASNASRYCYQDDNALQNPTDFYRYTIYAGPNFEFSDPPAPSPAAVPEPGSLMLTLAGIALVVATGIVRKRIAV